ncbi:hypothetical protein T09_1678 [Trichinella sp. T9]|nr:hypothetical protein T09_1678 [Trichinella sp. T9]
MAVPACFFGPFSWNVFFPPFTLNIHSVRLCRFIGELRSLLSISMSSDG